MTRETRIAGRFKPVGAYAPRFYYFVRVTDVPTGTVLTNVGPFRSKSEGNKYAKSTRDAAMRSLHDYKVELIKKERTKETGSTPI